MPRTPEQYDKIRQDRKSAILDAALHVFAEESYHSASVSKIAKKAGVSKGLMYNYFESKEDLLKQLIFGLMDEISQRFGIDEKTVLTDEKMIEFINLSFDLLLEDPQFYKLYFAIFVQPDVMEIAMSKMAEIIQPYMLVFGTYFEGKGVENPMVHMRYFSAIIDGVQMHCMMEPETYPIEPVKAMIIKQFVG